jgi:surfeit locus 1 family protein
MFKTLLSRRYILMTLLVLLAMAVMARLGVWQLDRRVQRLARNADLAAKLEAPPLSLNDAAAAAQWPLSSDRDEIRNTQATASGQFDFDQQVLLLQQNHQDMPGVHLVTPLILDGSDKAILVDRGWIPADQVDAARQSQFDAGPDRVAVTGALQPSQILFGRAAERAAEQSEPSGPKAEWYRIDIAALQAQMPYELLPIYLLQAPGAEGNAALPYRIQPEVDLSEGPHLGYALQWFAFALTAGVVYVTLVRSREKKARTTTAANNGSANSASIWADV